ncbi:hypothetical protein Q5H93_10775 [Hymenobacter sp. ASUV-10]|uniref:DUF541 domain-containing protein n=1 Tax=Hymenobacter aranciens TaxID=3063996 RepID=A0ABT9BEX4_9BACT|nr:hypothetical protein [Hymenobacter sp. ASUV-10]MDO7875216.1 hypothetical protein [Hymenobacter sp. ASUV-10]
MANLIAWVATALALLPAGLVGAQSATQVPTVADTIPGQTLLLRRLSASMCQHLTAAHQHTDFSKLKPAAVQKLQRDITYQSLLDNAARFEVVQSLSSDEEKMGHWLTQEATLQWAETCPLARPLLSLHGTQALGLSVSLSAAERTALAPLAQDVCRCLDAENARQPFTGLEVSARGLAVQVAMQAAAQASIAANAAVLTPLYGAEAQRTPNQTTQLRMKIGQLVYERCPVYLNHISRSLLPGPPPPGPMLDIEAPPLLLPGGELPPPPPLPPVAKPRK